MNKNKNKNMWVLKCFWKESGRTCSFLLKKNLPNVGCNIFEFQFGMKHN